MELQKKRERKEKRIRNETGDNRKETQSRVGPRPPSDVVAQLVKDRIPHTGLNICAHVFIKSLARAAIVAANFERFANFQIISQLFFRFCLSCS